MPHCIVIVGEWTDAFLVLTLDNILDVYEDSTRKIRDVKLDSNSTFIKLNKSFSGYGCFRRFIIYSTAQYRKS